MSLNEIFKAIEERKVILLTELLDYCCFVTEPNKIATQLYLYSIGENVEFPTAEEFSDLVNSTTAQFKKLYPQVTCGIMFNFAKDREFYDDKRNKALFEISFKRANVNYLASLENEIKDLLVETAKSSNLGVLESKLQHKLITFNELNKFNDKRSRTY